MVETTTRWTPEMVQAWEHTRPVVTSVLIQGHRQSDVGDVMQATWLAANEALGTFDPERGSFEAWIKGIGYRQAKRFLREESRQGNLSEMIEHAAGSGIVTAFDVISEDIGETVTAAIGESDQVSLVLGMVRKAVAEARLFDRSMELIVECDANVTAAARRMGISVAALRDSHRNVMDMAQVVHKALSMHWTRREAGTEDAPVLLDDLLACLPSGEEEHRAWLPRITQVVADLGGFTAATPALVAAETGWSVNYARQCLNRTMQLLVVARTVIESGSLD